METGSSSTKTRNYVSENRSAIAEGRKRWTREIPEHRRERRRLDRGRNSKAKDRSDLYRALLLGLDLVSRFSRLRAILWQLLESGSEISLKSSGILRLIDVFYFAREIVIHIFLTGLGPGFIT